MGSNYVKIDTGYKLYLSLCNRNSSFTPRVAMSAALLRTRTEVLHCQPGFPPFGGPDCSEYLSSGPDTYNYASDQPGTGCGCLFSIGIERGRGQYFTGPLPNMTRARILTETDIQQSCLPNGVACGGAGCTYYEYWGSDSYQCGVYIISGLCLCCQTGNSCGRHAEHARS